MEATSNAGGDHGGLEGPQGKQVRWNTDREVKIPPRKVQYLQSTDAPHWRESSCDYAAPKLRHAALMPRMVDRRK